MKVMLIDGLGMAFRHYYARIGNPLRDAGGHNVSSVVGCRHAIAKLRDEFRPDLWCLAWESSGPKARHVMWPQYKSGRKERPPELASQFPEVQRMAFFEFGLPIAEVVGEEADDVMATLARMASEAGHDVFIHTADKDLLQMVSSRVTVLCPLSQGRTETIQAVHVKNNWGVDPERIADLLALMGDSSDGYPGCAGIGRVIAAALIRSYGGVDEIYKAMPKIKPEWGSSLRRGEAMARLSLRLATLRLELPLSLSALASVSYPSEEPADIPQ